MPERNGRSPARAVPSPATPPPAPRSRGAGSSPIAGGSLVDGRASVAGRWRSRHGSELRLEESADGALGGTYTSALGETHETRPVVGAHGAAQPDGSVVLGFLVRWVDLGSIAVWSGRYDASSDRIVATWLLSWDSQERDAWRSTAVGADEFLRDLGAA